MQNLEIYEYKTLRLLTRPGTSDLKAVKEVLEDDGYQRRYFKIKAGENWMDAGANIGAFTLLCHLEGATCTGYEAEPNNASFSNVNLQQNMCPSKIIHAAIVPDNYTDSTVTLWLHHTGYGNWRHTLYQRNQKQTPISVQAVRISTILPEFDCVKLDIEGAEIEILETVDDWQGIKKLVFEYHFDTDDYVPRYRAIIERLRGRFTHVRAPHIKEGINHYTWFPPAKVVFCWND